MTVDVLVVGAGPAGAVVARELARTGTEVLLVDRARFPRDKVCGGCLGAGALAELDALDIAVPDGPELRTLDLRVGRRRVQIPIAAGRSISRSALDDALLVAAREAGAAVRTGVEARLGPDLGDARLVHLGDDSVRARLVLAADGLGGAFVPGSRAARRSRLGAGARLRTPRHAPPKGTIEMICGPGGYVGATLDESGDLTVAAALDPELARERGIARAVDAIRASSGRPPLPELRWRGTPTLTRTAPVRRERVLPLGDAAGYVEPFTGEGMTWAIRSARALAPLAQRGWTAGLPDRWNRLRRQVVKRGSCRAAAALLRRPRAAAAVVALLGVAPALGSAWARAVHAR